MNRSREWQIAAILSRFNGNREQAYMYCASLAFAYPRLAEEYLGYMEGLCNASI